MRLMAISVTTCFWSTCYIYSSCQIIQRRLLGPVFIFDSVCEKIRFQMINVNKRRRKKIYISVAEFKCTVSIVPYDLII